MTISRTLLTAIFFTLLTACLSVAKAANISEQLLTMPITLTSGEVVTLKDYQGNKPVYLKFWATWCQPCMKQMPHFEEITQQYSDDLIVIGINLGINDNLAAIKKVQKEFNLTMPIAIDKNGDLAQAFRLLGTPYHLLFDKQMNLVHIGHEANSVLDNKIALISQNSDIDLLSNNIIVETESALNLNLQDANTHALLFTATWCDWYFKETRPAASQQCISAQKNVNQLAKKFNTLKWHGIVSRFWTGQTELDNYMSKYNIEHPVAIDTSNSLFHQYTVKTLPTLVIIKNGEIVFKTSDFSQRQALEKQLSLL
jgi:thiol-disulfide isomerase/thioredoxin